MKKFLHLSLLFFIGLISQPLFADLPKTLTIATEASYPPFESINAQGSIEGFDIDVVNALCKQIQVQCTFVNQPWDGLIPSLKLGKFDVLVGGMNITDTRKEQVDFTDPYYLNTASFVGKKTTKVQISKADLKDKIIGVQGGTTAQYFLEGEYPEVKIKTYASQQDAFLDLVANRVDLVLADTPVVKNWLQNNNNAEKYLTLGQPISNSQYFGVGYGIAVKKGNNELRSALNKALVEIKHNGSYDKIVKQYF
jgi:arginine transport system substrate-binding protein